MKKLKVLICGLFAFIALAAHADNEKPIPVTQLPAAARQFIEQHFAESKIALARMESDFMKKSYDVIFADGSQIEFDSKGNWKEIDCKFSSVPAAAVPEPILAYVRTNHPEAKIVKIEKDRREYEVKLSTRVELTFDLQFNLIDIDY